MGRAVPSLYWRVRGVYKKRRFYREPVCQVVGQHMRGVFPVGTGLIVNGYAKPRILVEIDVEAMVQA